MIAHYKWAGNVSMEKSPLFYDQLLATKFFIPASSHGLIPRPRLNALLNEGLQRRLTLVSAHNLQQLAQTAQAATFISRLRRYARSNASCAKRFLSAALLPKAYRK